MPQNNPPAAKFIAKLCIAVLGWVKKPSIEGFLFPTTLFTFCVGLLYLLKTDQLCETTCLKNMKN